MVPALLLVSQFSAQAQFPLSQSFTGPTADGFTLGGTAALTGTSAAPGYLRLTSASTNQAGYAILNGSFASTKGFNISFEFFSYGGNGADGFSVFLMDANGTDPTVAGQFTIGASGGGLGYAQSNLPGVSKGYMGIGIDEFGNYSSPDGGRVGGPGATPQAVALRGPGTGQTGYNYLSGSPTLPFTLNVPTVRAQPGSDDYRKAYIYVVPANGAYTVTIRIQHGTTITTTTNAYPLSTPPANLRIGFAGSTGGLTDIHEIRNLAVLANPYAVDDAAGTPYTTAVSIPVLSNDHGLGAAIDPTTVDLDPGTAGIQNTFSLAGKGTFTATNQGVVTFTPTGTFAGVASTPYVMSDVVGLVSNPALITVTVTGADVTTSVSGPASVVQGASITYVVATTNLGSEVATNLTPTLQLPRDLSIPASTSYTYGSATGLLTFSAVTLAANGSVSNSVTFPAPVAGPATIGATSGYTYPAGAGVPDPVASNNSSTQTTRLTVPAPVITSFTPTSGIPGTAVTVTGTNFTGATAATLNWAALPDLTVVNSTTFTFTVPTATTTGPIAVTTPTGTGTSPTDFAVLVPNPVPAITSLSPATAVAGSPDFTLTVDGTNFISGSSVTFNGTALAIVNGSATQITVTVPAAAIATAGKYAVTVINAAPGGGTSTPVTFTVTAPAPTITSFTPTSGGPGTVVILTGTNFTGATGVSIGTVNVPSFTVVAATSLRLVVPGGTGSVSGVITVLTPGGTATSALPFNLVSATWPSPALPGLTIYPNPFQQQLTVTLPTPGVVRVALWDLTGRRVLPLAPLAGEAQLRLPALLAPGIYLLEVQQGAASAWRRVEKR